MDLESSNFFEGKKRKKIKPAKLKIGRRVFRYSRIDQWLKAVQSLIKDIEELTAAKKKAEQKMKKIKKNNNTKSENEGKLKSKPKNEQDDSKK